MPFPLPPVSSAPTDKHLNRISLVYRNLTEITALSLLSTMARLGKDDLAEQFVADYNDLIAEYDRRAYQKETA